MKKEVKILEYKSGIVGEKDGRYIMKMFWYDDGKKTTTNIKELLEKYLSEGWKIEFANETYYILSRQAKYEKEKVAQNN